MPTPHNRPMMKCGHAANATKMLGIDALGRRVDGPPCCAICAPAKEAYEIEENAPDLRAREARCPSCDKRRPSSPTLAFFEFRGPGSRWDSSHPSPLKNAKPGGLPFDDFYCGCRGWE